MSQYQPYTVYKNSETEWLGEVPETWSVLPCRALVDQQTRKNDGAINNDYLSLMANVGVIPYAEKGDIGNKKPENLSKCKLVSKGDLVINSMNYGIGSYGLSELDGVCSPVYIVLRPRTALIEERFALRVFENRQFQKYAQSFGTGILDHRAAIGWDDLKGIKVCLPSLDEQAKILQFVDQETARIDALISKKTNFIQLLREKRRALITQAVTKGLDLNVKMKDSGVEWIGMVPDHWDVLPVKLVARVGNGSTPSRENLDYWTDGNYPWLNSSVVNQEIVTCAEEFVTELALKECHLPKVSPPAILVGITGQGRTRGMATTLVFEATINQHVAFVKPDTKRMMVEYLRRVFDMSYQYLRGDSDGGGSTKGAITCEQIASLPVPVPSVHEQSLIATYIDDRTSRLEELISKTERSIELLKERRSALITAAVTGKIDLREAA